MSSDIWSFMDVFVLAAGFYALYAAWILKREGKITKTFLAFNDTDVNTCKDLQGYANFMAPKLYTLAGTMILYAVVALINSYAVDVHSLALVILAAFMVVLVWYGFMAKKALDAYF
jgi:flagellar biosynthesis protein FlhB